MSVGLVSVKAENKNPGMAKAKGAMAPTGAPNVAIVNAVIGKPVIMPANIRLRVSIGKSRTMLIVLDKKSLSSYAVTFGAGVKGTTCKC